MQNQVSIVEQSLKILVFGKGWLVDKYTNIYLAWGKKVLGGRLHMVLGGYLMLPRMVLNFSFQGHV